MTKASGFRYYLSGVPSNFSRNGYYWSSVPSGNAGGNQLSLGSGIVFPLNNGARSFGFAVRPVKEN